MTAAILVGGRARRLGGLSKPDLRIGTTRILDRQLAELRAAGFADIVLVGRWAGDAPASVHRAPDLIDGAGALGGLYSALLMAASAEVLVLAGDMPFVSAPLLARLAEMHDEDAHVPYVGGR